MDKVRVYELARELEISSPEAIQLLKDKLKIRVKSASSTIEEDVATKLKRQLRLDGLQTPRRAASAEPAAVETDSKARARSRAKQRADKARQALLLEMDAEDLAKKRQEEAAVREKEEADRRAQEEEQRRASEAAARLLEEQEAERRAQEAEALRALEAIEGPDLVPETSEEAPVEIVATEPETSDVAPAVQTPTESVEVTVSSAGSAAPGESRPAASATTAPAESSPAPPPRPGKFVPGPTSTYVRTRPPRPPVTRGARPQPPRPAAPIKTVNRRRPDTMMPPSPAKAKGKGKSKSKSARQAPVSPADYREQAMPEPRPSVDDPRRPAVPQVLRKVSLTEGVTVKELAEKMEARHKDVIKTLMSRGVLATINQTLDADTAVEIAKLFGCEAEIVTFEEEAVREEAVVEKPEDLESRAPVVTVMGHVDHGKTSLLDAIRETKVVEKEAGGITQHVGAYKVDVNKQRSVVFLDTPGHEAFTMMRARGARVTDLVILVVAADDGVMPQTKEAIDHSRAAEVPIMVVVNKIDKPNANPDRVKQQLADLELVPEDWGGKTVFCNVSAKQREGLDLLLEMVLLVADLQELKANPNRVGMGTVLEAKLDKGKGPVAHVLVQNGSVGIGDPFVAGAVWGKVRAMFDDRGHKVKSVGPSTPVEILGLSSLPEAGDQFQVYADNFKARQIGEFRQQKLRERQLASSARLTLDQLHARVQEGEIKELPIVLKADVQGSVEVLKDSLTKLSTDKVKIKIISSGAGAVSDTDVLLASASNAIIVGFNVRPQKSAEVLAEKESIDIRLHTVIYNITDELKKAMEGLLEPTFKEVRLGTADVRDTFKVPKIGTIAGCYIQEGRVTRGADVRLLRDNVVIHEGKLSSLRRFKEDVTEVKDGFECGIGIANYNDIKDGDVIEAFVIEEVPAVST